RAERGRGRCRAARETSGAQTEGKRRGDALVTSLGSSNAALRLAQVLELLETVVLAGPEMVICRYYHADDHGETRQDTCGSVDPVGAPPEGAEIRRDPGLDRSSGADRDRRGSDRVGRRREGERPGADSEEVVSR